MTTSKLKEPAVYFTGAVAALTVLMGILPAQAAPGPAFDFTAVDADKNGQITADEMTAFKAARATGMDADKDGFISADELSAEMMARMAERVDMMARHRLVDQDKDGDGKVSVAEMAEGQGEGRLFQRADANGDGALTQDEISAARAAMEEGAKGHGGKHRGGDHHGMGGMGGPFWPFDGAVEEPAE